MLLLHFLLILIPYSYQKATVSPRKPAYFSNETCSANYYEYSYEKCKWLPLRCDNFWHVYLPEEQRCEDFRESKECIELFNKLQARFLWIHPSWEEEKFCYNNGKASGDRCSGSFTLCHDYRPFPLRCKLFEEFDGKSCRGYDSCRPEGRSKEVHAAYKESMEEDIPEFTCCGKADGFYALFTCSRNYIQCIRGKYHFKSCLRNDRFSPKTRRCQKQENMRACDSLRLDAGKPGAVGSLERARQHSNPSDYCFGPQKGEGRRSLSGSPNYDGTFHAQENSFGSVIRCVGDKATFRNFYFPEEFTKHKTLAVIGTREVF